ncbi:phytoene desaturase family protein [Paraliomyxa miuraensis]|uniref:phytoene desaturase family protein n=1 Tax=Paraliomyxa miuraensis TaxID=376150 RepID=UPI00224D0BB9|nr:NAD(P)/FAD-dependent oxidoreductase [Paraliomyxa miuraensis]MCX4239695.1 NAD(P)/FAD-dependent oxidoreductase [Paraliomyxa miuraensis]
MSRAYDAIVIGAGHNGLTTAARLAKAGRRVLVLERRDRVGGLAAAEEFHPGYRRPGVLFDSAMVRPSVVEALGLQSHGLRLRTVPPTVLALGNGEGEGEPLPIHGDEDRAAEAIGRVSRADADAYRTWRELLRRLAPGLRALFGREPIDLVDIESEHVWALGKRALAVRRMGKADLMELLRLPPMAVADVLRERFASPVLQAALALPALLGSFAGPRSPGTMLELLRRECLGGPGVTGGGPMLVEALHRAALAVGVEVRTDARVRRLRLGADGVSGVELADGEAIDGRLVAASCHPGHTLCELLPPGVIEHRFEHRVRTLRSRGSVAIVSLALSRAPRLGPEPVEFARTGACLDDLERAFDPIKYREMTQTPVLDLHVATVADPSLAPEGHAVLCATVLFVPHAREGGWDDASRDALGERVVQLLSRHDAEIGAAVVAKEVLTPVELEAKYGLHGGHPFHLEHALDQLMIRPTPECIRYATPIAGLWLCGSGSHPGGGLSCAPGELAAQAILAAR